jgi:hypothetical protein
MLSRKYKPLKDYNKWYNTKIGTRGVVIRPPSGVVNRPDTKETITKDNIHALPSASVKTTENMNIHNENKFSDEYEKIINPEGEEVVSVVKPKGNIGKNMLVIIKWAENRRGRPFVNKPKQYKAMKKMRIAKISPKEIMERWIELENDSFWKDKLDLMTVASSFDKKPHE